MHLRKHTQGALVFAIALSLAAPAWAEKTLWLVRPLYPGQDTLVERTEAALDKLMPGAARQDSVIGKKELAAFLKGKPHADLPCFTGDARCADPVDPFIAGLAFDRVVLIQGGQDELGFKYRVVSYDPKAGKTNPATATNANLEKALLGAVAKVVPAASTLDVKTTPPGATVFVDDVKVGVTPLNTQVLPGERVIRLDLKLHQPIEEAIIIPIRGSASIEKTLDKVAARIVITASPPGTEISIDGAVLGKDKVDRGIAPGDHTIRLSAEGHRNFEQSINVKADQQYSLDKTLEPNPGTMVVRQNPSDPNSPVMVVRQPGPATPEDAIYERRSYFHVSFEMAKFTSPTLVGRRFDTAGFGRTTQWKNGAGAATAPTMLGVAVEYGVFGKYFGLGIIGLGYMTNADTTNMGVGFQPGESRESSKGVPGPDGISKVRANLFTLSALQPQFRVAVWRFTFGVQLGLAFRAGQITGVDNTDMSSTFYKDGFVPLDLLLQAKLNVKFFVVDGLFIHLQGNYTNQLYGNFAVDDVGVGYPTLEGSKTRSALDPTGNSSSFGFNLGVGYAF